MNANTFIISFCQQSIKSLIAYEIKKIERKIEKAKKNSKRHIMEHLLNGSHKEILSNLVQYVNENMKASRNDLERQKKRKHLFEMDYYF